MKHNFSKGLVSILYQELPNLDINKVNKLANKEKMKKQF